MLCEKCKIREANIILTEVVNGIKTEHNLCSQCASQTQLKPFLDGDFPFAKMLSGILGLQSEAIDEQTEKMNQLVCPTCHTTYGDFIKNSRFGCADCYDTFGMLLDNNMKKLHGNDTHVGKRPKFQPSEKSYEKTVAYEKEREDQQEQLEILQSRLQEAIREEEYESAARYRDEIKLLKERMNADA